MRSDAHAGLVSAEMRLATDLGLNGTPTIMVSAGSGSMPRKLEQIDFASIKAELDSLLDTIPVKAGGGR